MEFSQIRMIGTLGYALHRLCGARGQGFLLSSNERTFRCISPLDHEPKGLRLDDYRGNGLGDMLGMEMGARMLQAFDPVSRHFGEAAKIGRIAKAEGTAKAARSAFEMVMGGPAEHICSYLESLERMNRDSRFDSVLQVDFGAKTDWRITISGTHIATDELAEGTVESGDPDDVAADLAERFRAMFPRQAERNGLGIE